MSLFEILSDEQDKVQRLMTALVPPLTAVQGVSWDSPLFGRLEGVFVEPVGRRQIRVHHPLTGQQAVIPASWLLHDERKKP